MGVARYQTISSNIEGREHLARGGRTTRTTGITTGRLLEGPTSYSYPCHLPSLLIFSLSIRATPSERVWLDPLSWSERPVTLSFNLFFGYGTLRGTLLSGPSRLLSSLSALALTLYHHGTVGGKFPERQPQFFQSRISLPFAILYLCYLL